MLFNSYEFLFVFLPLTLGGFFLFGRSSRTWAIRWLIVASLGFYAWWRPLNVLIIAPSIAVNYLLARALLRYSRSDNSAASKRILLVGIIFNIAFLGYFKYANFVVHATNDVVGTTFVMSTIILPLGISFITFQKIAFLLDVHARRIEDFTLQDYCLFVLFFPQMIAGPIVHYREMLPQFHRASCKPEVDHVAVGLTLFTFGLFKKVVLADGISSLVSPLYAQAALGASVSLIPAWLAAIGFTLQIYFDFSGYTDMALGLARLFGVRFPPNFNSPLRASSIIDFWLRWHMTLTRFLTAYIYNPLALRAARRRAARGLPAFGGRSTTTVAFLEVLTVPVIVTMFVSGVWHGAGYLFILWGLLHGVYITINHGWRTLAHRLWHDRESYSKIMRPIGWVLTFVAVTAAMVLFRSSNLTAAAGLLGGMAGAHGIAIPASIYDRLGPLAALLRSGDPVLAAAGVSLPALLKWTVGLGFIALAMPNTLEILSHYQPALGVQPVVATNALEKTASWKPSLAWALAVSLLAVIGILHLGGNSEFLYWQF